MASGFVNIRRDVDDKFYRYRMPILLTKIEGKGNGIKTVLPNMSDVARALSRPPSYTTKFFGCELGAQTSTDERNERYIVNGAHDANRLRELLDGFIDKFVLCKSCKNPETELVILKNGCRYEAQAYHLHLEEPADQSEEGDDELSKKIKAEAAELNQDAAIEKEDWAVDTSPEGQALNIAIYKKAEELGIEKKHKTVLILVTIFTEDVMVTSEKHQKALLGGIERLVGLAHPDLVPQVPKILMALYQEDILDEEVVTEWGTHDTSKRVRKASAPFLKWLEEADDDDSDEDDD
ncbi:domain found in IF2B/IF5-domain-containing protein [Mycena olivaceomarginata]|nr:domain found in IF2B/IF5-domain-containing protein [Mycena olivaceomarginata]